MYDKKLKGILFKIFITTVCLCTLVLIIGNRVNKFLTNSHYERVKEDLNVKAESYKFQVEWQLEADMQILNTISGFFRETGLENLNILHESNKKNHFMEMLVIYEDGKGMQSVINEESAKYINIEDMNSEIQEIYKESITGKEVVSDLFTSDNISEKIVAIAVPIYSEDKSSIEGVIIGFDTVDQFNISLSSSIKSDKQDDYVNIIKSDGEFIARSRSRLDNAESTSIYNMGMSLLDGNEVKSALNNGDDYYSLFRVDEVEYGVYFEHLDYTDWYIYIINATEVKNSYIGKVVYITKLTLTSIIGIILLFCVLAYFILNKNNKMLNKLAYYDELSGVYKSNHFRNICEYTLKFDVRYSICVFNIKKFKFINELLGENGANELLCYIREVLDNNIGESDCYCRDTADQFILFINSIDKEEVLNRIEKINNEIREFSIINNQNCTVEIYGGICSYIEKESTDISYKTMYDNALFSMKQSKKLNKDFVFYDEDINKDMNKESFIERYKQVALDNREFKLFLQPKVDLKTKKVISAEALVRWIRDDGTMIFPNDFIPIFENNGFCEKLDIYMIEEACKKLSDWKKIGIDNISISINQSKLLFYKSDYIETISSITKKYGVPNSCITLEILESLTIHNFEQFNTTIKELHSKGFKVSMDDFGSGYSSFNTLSKLKIDELKIDRDFLLKIDKDKDNENKDRQRIILKSIISLAKRLNIETVVEGVETEENLELISRLGCDMAQGYYFSRPLSVDDFEDKYIN